METLERTQVEPRESPPGIVIRRLPAEPRRPRVSAFIWGGKVRPLPTLPYGRWKQPA